VAGFEETLSAPDKRVLDDILSCSVAGAAKTVQVGIADFAARTKADELIITSHIYDHAKRLRSFEIMAEVAIAKN
jgi:alkanesulfonate monooxygenase SsuD/methylene tetrahydromethanopterin reductase-like flavin-dependent oxidoreductase (luciferase family)